MMAQDGGEAARTEAQDGRWPLPEGWCWATLGEVLPLTYGKALKKSEREHDGDALVYGSSGVVGRHSSAIAPAGSLIIGRKGSAGSVYLSKQPCWPIDTAYFATPSGGLSGEYWYHQLSALRLVQHDQSTAIPSLSRDNYSPIQVPLPPAAEQVRIAEKIDALFAQIEAGEAALAEARRHVARYRKAVLKAAVTGALTADWRAEHADTLEDGETLRARLLTERRAAWERDQIDKAEAKGKPLKGGAWKAKYKPPVEPETEDLPDLPEGWIWASLGQLTSLLTDGTHQAPKKAETGVPFVTISNIDPFRLHLGDVAKFVSEDEYSKHARGREVSQHDVLYTAVGSYGMAVTVRAGERFLIQRHIALLRPTCAVGSVYLTQYLNGPIALAFADKRARGVAQKTVTLGDLSEMPVALPSLAVQAEIVARVEAALEEANRLDAQLDAQARASKGLRQSVLKAAFEGRLAPQDPDDEPASALLERIKAERAAAANKPKMQTRRVPRG